MRKMHIPTAGQCYRKPPDGGRENRGPRRRGLWRAMAGCGGRGGRGGCGGCGGRGGRGGRGGGAGGQGRAVRLAVAGLGRELGVGKKGRAGQRCTARAFGPQPGPRVDGVPSWAGMTWWLDGNAGLYRLLSGRKPSTAIANRPPPPSSRVAAGRRCIGYQRAAAAEHKRGRR